MTTNYLGQIRKDPDWNAKNSAAWFIQNIPKLSASPQTMLGSGERRAVMAKSASPGNLYMYCYDPKFKKTLPMWDQFPIVFPFSADEKGFTGLNMHYLTPHQRLALFSRLLDLQSDKKKVNSLSWGDSLDNISWQFIKRVAQTKLAEKAVHRYLWPHVKSKFMMINPADWKIAILLPVAKFHYN